MNMLFDTAPDFDQPVDVLKHCHGRIRKQLSTMQKLLVHLPAAGLTAQAQQAASAALRYFDNAAPHHHADEEQDLLPMLRATAADDDLAVLNQVATQILDEHRQMEAAWFALAPQLRKIAAGEAAELSAEHVQGFVEMYTAHMEKEESFITPMAQRLFNQDQMLQLGNAMRVRRGIHA
ncbi:hemerythrin domain-containing protein [Herminiimonas sp. NPDC097707]|uniref:hemerythrin domain-containing protein n=1 Tax=Herminiimonas sp. NPDC097707 TaxID=3364007 RepID=UPI00383B05F1